MARIVVSVKDREEGRESESDWVSERSRHFISYTFKTGYVPYVFVSNKC